MYVLCQDWFFAANSSGFVVKLQDEHLMQMLEAAMLCVNCVCVISGTMR